MDQVFLKTLRKNFSWLFVGQGLASLANLACLSIIISSLGSETHGIFVVLTSILFLIGDITNFQTSNGVVHFLANAENNQGKKQRVVQIGIFLDVMAGLLAMLLSLFLIIPLLGFSGLNHEEYRFLYFFIPTLFFRGFNNGTFVGVLKSYSEFRLISYASIVLSFAKLFGFLFLFVLDRATLINFLIVEYLGEFLRELLPFLLSLKVFRRESINIFELKGSFFKFDEFEKKFCKFNLYNGFSLSLDLVLGHVSSLIISRFLGGAPISYIRVIQKIGSVLIKFTSPLEQIFYPKMCELIVSNQKNVALNIFKKYFKWSSLIGFLFIGVLMGSYKVWAPHFISEPSSYITTTTLYLCMLVFNSSMMPVHGLMLAMGFVGYNAIYTAILNPIYLVLLFVLVPGYGLNAFVLLTLIQAVTFACLKLFHIVGVTRFFQGK